MAQYTELQTRKLISSYGGVGSIIETTQGALIINEFDRWLYFHLLKKGKIEAEENEIISDDRLLKRLQYFFPKLKDLIKVPANYSALYNATLPKKKEHIVNAEYFPKWFYCNKCGSFMHINDWYKHFASVYNSNDTNKINDAFTPPVCYRCYQEAVKKKERRKFYQLEQVRFILTAPNGNIKDIPWEQWTNTSRTKPNEQKENQNEDQQEQSSITFHGKCCNKQDLKYIKSEKFSDFAGVQIKCKNPQCQTKGKPRSLAGLFGVRLFCEEVKDKEGNIVLENGKPKKFCYKPVIRTSNSVYYPLITNSLYLPHKESLSKDDKLTAFNLFHNKKKSIEDIADFLDVPISTLNDLFNPSDFIKETDYRLKEYLFLTNEASPNDENLNFEEEKSKQIQEFGIHKLLKIQRLKLTSVQTGYSRQEPIDKDLYANYSMDDFVPASRHTVKAKYTSTAGNKTEILPGVESFGEGVFIDFEESAIKKWYELNIENEIFANRLKIIKENALNSSFRLPEEKQKMIENPEYLSKFIFIHTFSHILIKELEFLVGYPATSLSERLYINDNQMQGILIYTIAGAEGSFGGLVSQGQSDRFAKIVNSAIERAKDCASDPICYNSDGQGIGGLNLAACYSCTLLPETSCEEFNSYLDRSLLIDNEFGYFADNEK